MPPRNHDYAETYSNSGTLQGPWAKGDIIVSLGVDVPATYKIIAYVWQNIKAQEAIVPSQMFGIHADDKALIDRLPGAPVKYLPEMEQVRGPFEAKALIVTSATPITIVANELTVDPDALVYAWLSAVRINEDF